MSTDNKPAEPSKQKPEADPAKKEIGVNSAPFDDSPQREDETLSGVLGESDPESKTD